MRAGIALGSNLGNRSALLEAAISQLRTLHEQGEFLISSLHETDPVDCPPGSESFLNGVVELDTSLAPLELLQRLQHLELASGRPRVHGRHAPRTLDLDLLYCDGMTLHHPDLELPHPRITERHFVLAPLHEIRPDLLLPGWSMNCADYLFRISNK
ncbi:MAG: 2-amino-4-hydroxy-6-hydroxymethyldihydropteridine diphosphokinase [Verrucomicrobiota bacterium]|jgi:2-amino-4-hydroxy-6-hydroxymethyldihydropteridine diphosphokinase